MDKKAFFENKQNVLLKLIRLIKLSLSSIKLKTKTIQGLKRKKSKLIIMYLL